LGTPKNILPENVIVRKESVRRPSLKRRDSNDDISHLKTNFFPDANRGGGQDMRRRRTLENIRAIPKLEFDTHKTTYTGMIRRPSISKIQDPKSFLSNIPNYSSGAGYDGQGRRNSGGASQIGGSTQEILKGLADKSPPRKEAHVGLKMRRSSIP